MTALTERLGAVRSPEWDLDRGCTFCTLSERPRQGYQRQLLLWNNCSARPSWLSWEQNPAAPPVPLSWRQTNTLPHICFNHSLNVNMEETQEMTGWLLTFPPCNAHILRAPTGRLIYQNKHTKQAKLFALILGINYLTSWLKCKQEKLKKELLEVNFPSTFKENNLLKL